MSFSKARIQRFNELTSQVPPPGAYDPKFDVKVPGSRTKKGTGRYNDAKSTTSSGECNASTSRRINGIEQFRTPQLTKKHVKPTGLSCPRAKTKLYTDFKESQSKYETKHELADLKVECANKDKTIHEYEKQLEDVKAKLLRLQNEYTIVEKQHQKEIESMGKLQQEVLDNSNEKYQDEIQALKFQLSSILKSQEEEVDEKRRNEEILQQKISNLEQKLLKQKEQSELINNVNKFKVAANNFDRISEDLNDELNINELQITDSFILQSETEQKLNNTQMKSEKLVTKLEGTLESIDDDINTLSLTINQQLIEEMTTVLQEYIDYDNSDGKWNIKNVSFDPDIENFLRNIRKFIITFKLAYEHEIELLRDNFNEERENLEEELDIKIALVINLENKLAGMNETNIFITEELHNIQKLYKDMSLNNQEIKNELELVNDKYAKSLAAHKAELELTTKIHLEERNKLKDLLEEARNEYLKELDNMTTARNEELSEVKHAMEKRIEDEKKRLKESANKMIENAEAVTRETLKACRAESEERVRRAIAETDALTREAKNNTEDELRKVTEKYNVQLNCLENEKDALASKLSQQDVEIIQLTAALEEMKCTAETQESFSQSLQAELDRAEAELVEKKEELRNLKDQIRMESAEMVARRRRFKVVMSENQASVAALTHRLAQTETEVERLQKELQSKEDSMTRYCQLFETIAHDSKFTQEQLNSITNKVEERIEIINQLEAKSVMEIDTTKKSFDDKIENLKNVTIDELTKVQKECKVKSEQIIELKESLHEMSDRLSETINMLLKLEEINDRQSIEMSQLELQNVKIQQQLDNKNKIIEENNLSFTTQLHHCTAEISEANEQLLRLKEEIKILEEERDEAEQRKYSYEELQLKHDDQIKILTESLQSIQTEKDKIEKQSEECDQVCQHLRNECKQITEKYTEIVNHSNHRKRINHVSQLNEKIETQRIDLLRLRQELESKNDLINELHQTNEKLKLSERRQLGVGKENLHLVLSPHKTLFSKSANTTPVASPHKPHTPLRDRND